LTLAVYLHPEQQQGQDDGVLVEMGHCVARLLGQ
jgi:hypothetical protein